jgi:hypothetical protein
MVAMRTMVLFFVFSIMYSAWVGCGGRKEEAGIPTVTAGVNLVTNPSFEEWDGFMPVGWELQQIAGEGKNANMFGKSTKEMKSGRFAYYLRGLFNTDKWMVLVQRFPVAPGHDLVFSAEIKCENIKRNKGQEDNANIYVRFLDADGNRLNDRYYADAYTRRRLGTGDWNRDSKKVEVPEKARFVEIGLTNQMTGYLYVDDVEVMLQERIRWEKEETKYVTFYYLEDRPYPEGAIKEESKMIERLADMCDIKIKDKIKYYLYPSEERFMQIQGTKKYNQRPFWKKKELHTMEPVEQHAMIHMLLVDYGYPPIGLAKGLVFALRGYYTGWDPHLLAKKFVMEKRVPALYKIIEEEQMRKSAWSVTIPAWASFCKFLIDSFGMEKFMNFYSECNGINEPGPFNDLFVKNYDKEFKVVDRAWRLYVIRIQVREPVDSLDLMLPPAPAFEEETGAELRE